MSPPTVGTATVAAGTIHGVSSYCMRVLGETSRTLLSQTTHSTNRIAAKEAANPSTRAVAVSTTIL